MDCSEPVIGRVVYSKAGRDKGKILIVVGIIDDSFVLVADGDIRPIERPKKKRMKHLKFTDITVDYIAELINKGDKPTNSELKNTIAEFIEQIT
ncbi:MAG TPA: RNA-binding protein [Ruminiclostridium sp.]|nr:RNA-binding protein [Clostridiaceae bacterium]HAA25410.1 RNA-binding protein [Ruminiclostridium sp.]